MKIIITDIYDITPENVDQEKVAIADNVLNQVGPLFEREIKGIQEGQENLVQQKKQIGVALLKVKNNLQDLQVEFNRETKRKKLLHRIRQLMDVGLTSDSSLRSEIIILLKVIDKMEDDLLDKHIESMIKTISKRFSKNL